jgi:hypothetical protein
MGRKVESELGIKPSPGIATISKSVISKLFLACSEVNISYVRVRLCLASVLYISEFLIFSRFTTNASESMWKFINISLKTFSC